MLVSFGYNIVVEYAAYVVVACDNYYCIVGKTACLEPGEEIAKTTV